MDYWAAGSGDTRYIVLILGRRIQLYDHLSLRLHAVRRYAYGIGKLTDDKIADLLNY